MSLTYPYQGLLAENVETLQASVQDLLEEGTTCVGLGTYCF